MKPTKKLLQPLLHRLAPFAIAAILSVPLQAQGGYETLTAPPGKLTLLGQRLLNNPIVAGDLDISGTSLFDLDVNFDGVLSPPPARYLVELIGGASDGKVLEVVSFAMNTLIVDDSLPSEDDVSYQIRPVRKLSELITPMEPQATDDFNPDNADLILLPKGGGQFDQYFVSSAVFPPEYANVFINVATGLPEDPYLPYRDGFFYLRRAATSLFLVVVGDLKAENTIMPVADKHNYFSSIYPVGSTLETTDLAASLQPGTADTADLVWIQDGSGDFHAYFYSDGTPPLTTGWRQADAPPGSENVDQANVEPSPGFSIRRRAPTPYEALMTPPGFYAGP